MSKQSLTAITWEGGSLVLDAVVSIAPTHDAEITEHPIETGGVVVDHVAVRPTTVQIEGVVVNSPLRIDDSFTGGGAITSQTRDATFPVPAPGAPAFGGNTITFQQSLTFVVNAPDKQLTRIEDVLQELRTAQREARIFIVSYAWDTFPDMVLQNIAPTHSVDRGDSMGLSLTFREVRLVEAQRTEASREPTRERTKRPKNKGKDQAEEVTSESEKQSILALGADFITGG